MKEELIQKIGQYTNKETITTLTTQIEQNNKAEEIREPLEQLQTINEAIYNHNGFNNTTLELQIYINQIRNKYDIHDPTEVIPNNNNDEDGEWVQ